MFQDYRRGAHPESLATLYQISNSQVRRIISGILYQEDLYGLSTRARGVLEHMGFPVQGFSDDSLLTTLKDLYWVAEKWARQEIDKKLRGEWTPHKFEPLPNRYVIIYNYLMIQKNCSDKTAREILKFFEGATHDEDSEYLCIVPQWVTSSVPSGHQGPKGSGYRYDHLRQAEMRSS